MKFIIEDRTGQSASVPSQRQSFGARIHSGWRAITDYLDQTNANDRAANDNQRTLARQGTLFITMASDLLTVEEEEGPDSLSWLIAACIASGINRRDDIVPFVTRISKWTFRHVGYQLDRSACWAREGSIYRLVDPNEQERAA